MASVHEEIAQLANDSRFKVFQYFYDANDNLIYLCRNKTANATDSDITWEIFKFTWVAGTVSGYNITQKEGPRGGSITNRASLTWRV